MAILHDYNENTGVINMQEDERLLDNAIENNLNEPILRLYGWKPACVSLGRNQSEDSVNKEYCAANNIDIIKRLTGGRALLHDDELTYSFVCPVDYLEAKETVMASYKEISGAIIESFKALGIDTYIGKSDKSPVRPEYCMAISTEADLCYQGKKIVGSAQLRKRGYILQHGSILMTYNAEKIETIFNEKIPPEKLISISEISGDITIVDLKNAFIKGFSAFFGEDFTR